MKTTAFHFKGIGRATVVLIALAAGPAFAARTGRLAGVLHGRSAAAHSSVALAGNEVTPLAA